jgi:hypothetical protein
MDETSHTSVKPEKSDESGAADASTPDAETPGAAQSASSPASRSAPAPLLTLLPQVQWAIAPLVFALLTFAMFLELLFSTNHVVGSQTADLALQFVPWRQFGFDQLAQGNLPLWNPHIYGGAPYFAGFQSALLYPPNWLHLILPLGLAINWITAIHVFLAGYFPYLWCRGRGIGIGGSILAGAMYMFGGVYFLHIYAGHLPHVAVLVWAPLMILAIEKLAETGAWIWAMLGIAATSMQILAGHPQYVYYTGIILSFYTLLLLITSKFRVRLVGGFALIYVVAVLITAVQLLPGLQAAREQVRAGGLDIVRAGTFSLPPENLITLVAPNFFGKIPVSETPDGARYWGYGYLWELSFFVSVSGLVLAILGLFRGQKFDVLPTSFTGAILTAMRAKTNRNITVMLLMLIIFCFALGRHFPELYKPLYNYAPMYGSFRGTVKFAYLLMLFVGMLAGTGFDGLVRNRRVSMAFLMPVTFAAIGLMVLGIAINSSAAGGDLSAWGKYVHNLVRIANGAGDYYFPMDILTGDALKTAAKNAMFSCLIGGGSMLVVIALLWASRLHKFVPYGLLLFAVLELFVFARATRASLDVRPSVTIPNEWKVAMDAQPKDERVLVQSMIFCNTGMYAGYQNINGYDPGVLKRYAELIYASQNMNPSAATQDLAFNQVVLGIFRMLRCGLVCLDSRAQPTVAIPQPLPVALLVSDWVPLTKRDDILIYMLQPNFDPANTVVLEEDPGVKTVPNPAAPGTVKAVTLSTDSVEIEAAVTRPAILVVTNNYSTGWRVVPIEQSQSEYKILPANYTQIGIPLNVGRHHFILEYSPFAFRAGRWISILSVLGYAGAGILLMIRGAWFR